MKIQTITALVPMRHHSQRVPGKNYRPLDGRPLYQHILSTLLNVPEITQIVVDTDSPEVIQGVNELYPTIKILRRPEELRADTIPMNEILMYDTGQYPADLYLQTHSTNPLMRAETFSKGIQTLVNLFPSYDSLFGVTRLQSRLWDGLGRAINHNPNILLQTQDLPPVYEENSCMYLFTRDTLEKKRNRLGDRPYLFEISRDEAWDIDEEIDFKLVELLIRARAAK
ncbi:MAG: acylneuraminate cytidylyltransferase family protein [Anaerolineaceae bacterium]|nr:acylneuraminate cytidylyltransferase family protein [Anaerolineaceae bacterium]